MSETPLQTMSSASQKSESLISIDRVQGNKEFWYYASKTKTSIINLFDSLQSIRTSIIDRNILEAMDELEAEMKRYDAHLNHLTEKVESSDFSESSSSTSK